MNSKYQLSKLQATNPLINDNSHFLKCISILPRHRTFHFQQKLLMVSGKWCQFYAIGSHCTLFSDLPMPLGLLIGKSGMKPCNWMQSSAFYCTEYCMQYREKTIWHHRSIASNLLLFHWTGVVLGGNSGWSQFNLIATNIWFLGVMSHLNYGHQARSRLPHIASLLPHHNGKWSGKEMFICNGTLSNHSTSGNITRDHALPVSSSF